MARYLLVLAAMIMGCGQVSAEPGWRWVKVEPQDNHNPVSWVVTQGDADVAITGNHFHADLKLEDGPQISAHVIEGADLRLDGTLEHGKILATETIIGTDANPFKIHGVMTKSGSPFQTQRIVFSGDGTFLGLTRLVQIAPFRQNPKYCAYLKKQSASDKPAVADYNRKALADSGCP